MLCRSGTEGGRFFTFCIKPNYNSATELHQNRETYVSSPIDGCLIKALRSTNGCYIFPKINPVYQNFKYTIMTQIQ